MHPDLQSALARDITKATDQAFESKHCTTCGGGCVNEAVLLSDGSSAYFIKLNAASKLSMFETEAAALTAMHTTHTIHVPRPITDGTACGNAYLVLEALELGNNGSTEGWRMMGQQLAAMHRHTNKDFGWHQDNTIGSTPQPNSWSDNWAVFFRDQRLGYQLKLARQNGYPFEQAEALLEAVPNLLADHQPEPSLLHGDLWSGNAGFTTNDTPVVYDPASYYGDRETDLAFSEYFGGFPSAFYQGYQAAWPLAPGHERRKVLYNLYHVLNHANLFGGGYASEAERMIHSLLN